MRERERGELRQAYPGTSACGAGGIGYRRRAGGGAGRGTLSSRLVISLGGNAFTRGGEAMSMSGQFAFAAQTLAPMADLLDSDRQLLITHGNGPQVRFIRTRVEEALKAEQKEMIKKETGEQ